MFTEVEGIIRRQITVRIMISTNILNKIPQIVYHLNTVAWS